MKHYLVDDLFNFWLFIVIGRTTHALSNANRFQYSGKTVNLWMNLHKKLPADEKRTLPLFIK